MSLFKILFGSVLLLGIATPAAAKIYPDDFLIPEKRVEEETPETEPEDDAEEGFFFASEIPYGPLTRSDFIDMIATRLYDADAHDNCFGDLVLSNTIDYSLLFNDVTLDPGYASSVCIGMRNGIMQGYADGTFRPTRPITAAEAAAVFGDLGGLPLADSNHVRRGAPWYERYMDAMRAVDRGFTMKPGDIVTGAQLKHMLCVLKRYTPGLDPLDEFGDC